MARSSLYHRLFVAGIVIKGIDGAIEVIGGLVLAFVSKAALQYAVFTLARGELSDDPHDFIATHAVAYAAHLPVASQHFAAAYLLAHGAVKLFLSVNLLREKRWVFPISLSVLGALLLYQAYRLALHLSWPLLIASAVDAVVLVAVWREWNTVKNAGTMAASGVQSGG
jgi:uncharacterized membrane protein